MHQPGHVYAVDTEERMVQLAVPDSVPYIHNAGRGYMESAGFNIPVTSMTFWRVPKRSMRRVLEAFRGERENKIRPTKTWEFLGFRRG